MRFLPYVLIAFMAAPIVLWLVIEFVVLGNGSTTRFAQDNLWQVTSLSVFMLVSFFFLGRWMSAKIEATRG